MLPIHDDVVILIDWLTFTSFFYDEKEVITDVLKMDIGLFQETERGRNGYKKGLYYDSISIWYDGNDDMGVCVNLSGQGCRAFESDSRISLIELLDKILTENAVFSITRLDVALDETSGLLDLVEISRKTMAGEYSTRIQSIEVTTSKKGRENPIETTIYFGSSKSPLRIRFYDKAKERGDFESHWVRCEMQLRDEYAVAMASLFLLDRVGESVGAVLHRHLRFVDVTMSSANFHKNKTSLFWLQFLNTVNKINLVYHAPREYNLERALNWMEKQVAPTYLLALKCIGSVGLYERMTSAADGRLSKKQLDVLKEWTACRRALSVL